MRLNVLHGRVEGLRTGFYGESNHNNSRLVKFIDYKGSLSDQKLYKILPSVKEG